MTVLLDTNALMMPVQCRIDLFDELGSLLGAFEPVVLRGVIDELEGLAAGRGRDAAAARLGIALAARCTVVPAPSRGLPVDEQLAAYAEAHRCPVVTNDRGLREALLSRGISVISLKNERKLEMFRR
jgi:rRNA-processing protein FCF1